MKIPTMQFILLTRETLVSVLKEWREEWDASPNQFLISEAFRQSDAETYAEQVADHLLAKLIVREFPEGGVL